MRPLYWKLSATILAGAMLGAFTGQATIAGMAPPTSITPKDRFPELASGGINATRLHAETDGEAAGYARIADACADCSDYDLGYRFAASRRLETTAECMDYSWSYQRGCLAYMRRG